MCVDSLEFVQRDQPGVREFLSWFCWLRCFSLTEQQGKSLQQSVSLIIFRETSAYLVPSLPYRAQSLTEAQSAELGGYAYRRIIREGSYICKNVQNRGGGMFGDLHPRIRILVERCCRRCCRRCCCGIIAQQFKLTAHPVLGRAGRASRGTQRSL